MANCFHGQSSMEILIISSSASLVLDDGELDHFNSQGNSTEVKPSSFADISSLMSVVHERCIG